MYCSATHDVVLGDVAAVLHARVALGVLRPLEDGQLLIGGLAHLILPAGDMTQRAQICISCAGVDQTAAGMLDRPPKRVCVLKLLVPTGCGQELHPGGKDYSSGPSLPGQHSIKLRRSAPLVNQGGGHDDEGAAVWHGILDGRCAIQGVGEQSSRSTSLATLAGLIAIAYASNSGGKSTS